MRKRIEILLPYSGLLGIICILCINIGCNRPYHTTVTEATDYNEYLVSQHQKLAFPYHQFKKEHTSTTSALILAEEYTQYFKETGKIVYLKEAEHWLKRAVLVPNLNASESYRALAKNYLLQHRFREALILIDSARYVGGKIKQTQYLSFDVHMELGNYNKAFSYLDSIQDKKAYDYLARKAKWYHYKGNTKEMLQQMEAATKEAELSNRKGQVVEAYTLLADYYGQVGRIEEAYDYYLKTLEIAPENVSAKRGIAWIVFSYENNPKEALRILDSVTQDYNAPEYYLLKAEIADYMGKDIEFVTNLDEYFKKVNDPAYGSMYNACNVSIYVEKTGQLNKALELALTEVENRPTPASYQLLAYTYLKSGEKERALNIVEKYVAGKTVNPEVLYKAAEVYKANGLEDKLVKLKPNLLESLYQLGPSMEGKVVDLYLTE